MEYSNRYLTLNRVRLTHPKNEALAQVVQGRLRPLVVSFSRAWGGFDQTIAADILDLAHYKIPVELVCLKNSPIADLFSPIPEVVLHCLDETPNHYLDFRFKRFLQERMASGINLIHSHNPYLLGSMVAATWNTKKTALVASKHFASHEPRSSWVSRRLGRRLDALIVPSIEMRDEVREQMGLRRPQVRLIHAGVDFEAFDPFKVDPMHQRLAWGADRDSIVIGMVGRIDPKKGQHIFIQAAAALKMRIRSNIKVRFVIVGEEIRGKGNTDLGYLDELQDLVQTYGLIDDFVFTGYQENIPEIMSAMDVLVHPAPQDSLSLVILEAMAMKVALVLAGGGAADDVVQHQEYAMRVRPNDPFDLQLKLRKLVEDDAVRESIGSRAIPFVRQNYDAVVRFEKTLRVYDRCLKRHGL